MRWGPERIDEKRWRFSLWAPNAREVSLELDGRAAESMQPDDEGWFTAESMADPGDRYRFRVSQDLAVPDPASRAQTDDVHGWSVIVDDGAYRWRTEGWRGRPWEETVIYEVHAGLLGGFRGAAERLPELAELGITAIELMPVADFYGSRNWGYDGVLPYAPDAAYGAPEDLKALIDRAHELGLMVFLDVVYNHFGPEGNYLGAYASQFFHNEVRTPWGDAIAFDREPVRRFFIDNALMWLRDYRFDGLRLDAVHAIGEPTFLDALSHEVRAATGPDRHVHLILENEHNEARRLESAYEAQWNDDFHNTVHVLLTGETEGYYGDFADKPAQKLARILAEGFAYQGDLSPGSGNPRGSPSGYLPPTSFVAFLQNHDQTGNRAMGERLTLLTDAERLRAATALLLLMPQIPLLFMGEEVGSRSPFLFFTDFHDELADAVREGRRKEFARFEAFADPKARERIPDPNAPDTFERSRPQPGPDAEEWRAFYRDLLALRAREIVPRLRTASAITAKPLGDGAVLASWRLEGGAKLSLYANLGQHAAVPNEAPTREPLFALGKLGLPGSFAAWLDPQ